MLKIRAITHADLVEVAAMANDFARTQGAVDSPVLPESLARAFLERDCGVISVAERDGALCGYVSHRPDFETSVGAIGRYIADLYVAPPYRRSGVATALIAHVAEQSAVEGGAYVWWVTADPHGAAGALYRGVADISADLRSFALAGEPFRKMVRRASNRGV